MNWTDKIKWALCWAIPIQWTAYKQGLIDQPLRAGTSIHQEERERPIVARPHGAPETVDVSGDDGWKKPEMATSEPKVRQ